MFAVNIVSDCLMDPEFIRGFVSCLAVKFQDLIDLLPMGLDDLQMSGSKLPSHFSLDSLNLLSGAAFTRQTMHQMTEDDLDLIENLNQLLELLEFGGKEEALNSIVENESLKKLLGMYMPVYNHVTTNMRAQMKTLHQYLAYQMIEARSATERNSFDHPFCGIPALDFVCPLAECLMKYEPSDFEDNIEWLECLLHCE